MHNSSENLEPLRSLRYVSKLTGRSRSSIYNDMAAGLLDRPICVIGKNAWLDCQVRAYYQRLITPVSSMD